MGRLSRECNELWWGVEEKGEQEKLETQVVEPGRLRVNHVKVTSRPHSLLERLGGSMPFVTGFFRKCATTVHHQATRLHSVHALRMKGKGQGLASG